MRITTERIIYRNKYQDNVKIDIGVLCTSPKIKPMKLTKPLTDLYTPEVKIKKKLYWTKECL